MTDTQHRKFAAYWYAVGRHDAGDGPDLAVEFATFAKAQAAAYYDGNATFLACVGDQWREFQAQLVKES